MKSNLTITHTAIADLYVIQRNPCEDNRGYFERLFCSRELETVVACRHISQINHSWTKETGTIRGLHFQYPPCAELKFVSCLKGQVYDIALDIRRNSSSFLKWHAEILSADNHRTLIIPEGFAHGFQTLTDDCEMLYFHTQPYSPDAAGILNSMDPQLQIPWPLPPCAVSSKDINAPLIDHNFKGIQL